MCRGRPTSAQHGRGSLDGCVRLLLERSRTCGLPPGVLRSRLSCICRRIREPIQVREKPIALPEEATCRPNNVFSGENYQVCKRKVKEKESAHRITTPSRKPREKGMSKPMDEHTKIKSEQPRYTIPGPRLKVGLSFFLKVLEKTVSLPDLGPFALSSQCTNPAASPFRSVLCLWVSEPLFSCWSFC